MLGAGSGGRTRTVSPPRDFESRTSANSIIPALESIVAQGAADGKRFLGEIGIMVEAHYCNVDNIPFLISMVLWTISDYEGSTESVRF